MKAVAQCKLENYENSLEKLLQKQV